MITESDLYAICMESDTADKRVKELYEAFGFPLPQYFEPRTAKREIPDPFTRNSNEKHSSSIRQSAKGFRACAQDFK